MTRSLRHELETQGEAVRLLRYALRRGCTANDWSARGPFVASVKENSR